VLAARDSLEFVRAQKTAVSEQLAAAKRNFEVGTSTITDYVLHLSYIYNASAVFSQSSCELVF
jgi:outer membrane protein TolC